MPSTAHVVRAYSHGGPEVLVCEPSTVEAPALGEALLRQTAVGVNYLDLHYRRGELPLAGGLPFVNGVEGVGVIEALGEACPSDLRVGQRVGYMLAVGAYATRRCVPAARLVPLPDSLTDLEAAAVLLKGTTAEYLSKRLRAIQQGDVVLVHGASGGVGSLLTQWAKQLGAVVIGTVGSEAKAELARTAGRCDHVVVMPRPDTDFVTPIEAVLGPTPVSVVYDGIAGGRLHRSLALLRARGCAVVLGHAGGKAEPLDVHALKARSLTVSSPSLAHFTATRIDLLASAAALFDVLASGSVKPFTGQRYALEDAAQAHRDLEARLTTGPSVLVPAT